MITKQPITYKIAGGYYPTIVIPAGTRCDRAHNLPQVAGEPRKYWARGWRGMGGAARAIKNSIGFLLTADEIKGK